MFAGQQDTILNVIGDAALLVAVVQCWSSLWTARAIGYRARNGITHEDGALAVIVQQMVASEVSGVRFTANPLTGKRSETIIEATFGLGEALVSGRVEPDRYVVDVPAGRVLARRMGGKALSVRPRAEGGTLEAQEDAAGRATLRESAALELATLGQRVAALFDAPQDIEWAQAGERFHLLQTRPITSLFPLPEGLAEDGLHVLISVGAIQGMLDPITPLGTDVFRVVMPRGLSSLGGPVAHARPSLIAGERWFLDVTGFLRRRPVRAIVRDALRVIEPTTGEALDDLLTDVAPEPVKSTSWLRALSPRFLAVIGRALGNMTYNLLWPDRGRARTQRRLAAAIDAFRQRSAAARSLAERVALLQQAFDWVLQSGLPLLMPALAAGLGSLRVLDSIAAELPDGGRRTLELTRGLPHNVTTEMDLALWGVAPAIRGDSNAAAFLRAEPSALARAFVEGRLRGTCGDPHIISDNPCIWSEGRLASSLPLEWHIAALGDVDGNGTQDLIWRHSQTGDVAVWLMTGVVVTDIPIVASAVPLAWQIAGAADVTGDGKADIVWRNVETGDVALWVMEGPAVKRTPIVSADVPLAWQIAALGDVSGDGRADLIWRHTPSGGVAVWMMNAETVTQSSMIAASVPSAWQIVGAGDLDGDRKADLVWHQNQTGDVAVWIMNGASVVTGPIVSAGVPLSWRIVKLADVNGDGKTDLVWRHDQPQTPAEIVYGEVAVWQMDGTTVTRTAITPPFTEQIYQSTAKWQIQ